jgi:PAS domain S-box-containing protein
MEKNAKNQEQLVERIKVLERQLQACGKLKVQLQEAKISYDSLIQNIPVGIYRNTPGPKGKFILANPAIVSMFGYHSIESFLKARVSDLYEDSAERKKFSDKLMNKGKLVGEELWLKRKDGKLIWGAVTATVVRNEAGQIKFFDGIIEDITERKKTEEKLAASRSLYKALFDDNPSMYFTVSDAAIILSVNKFGAQQLGYQSSELIGQSVFNIIHEEDKEGVLNQIEGCIHNLGQVAHWEFRKVCSDGRLLWVREVARAVRDDLGNIIILIVCEDVTESKAIESELTRKMGDLERFSKFAVGRELKMIELKEKVNELEGKLRSYGIV